MIDHLHIKNFLAFPELVVPELKLINLVAGKNNTGKTALLEALWIFAADARTPAIEIVSKRRKGRLKYDPKNDFLGTGAAFFSNYPLFAINDLEAEYKFNEGVVLFQKREGKKEVLVEINYNPFDENQEPLNILALARSNYKTLSKLWNRVALTDDELQVLSILSSAFDKEIVRISVTDEQILILEKDIQRPYNVESLGEGAKRILFLALAIVNSKGGLLLVDEIETHLHHSVIRKLWKIIFEYAIKWNIQVVATTHSQDAIRELFYEAAANESYQDVSQVLRLQIGRNGKHEVIQYPYERLEFMMSTKMEIRGN